MTTARDLMTPSPDFVDGSTTVLDVAKMLAAGDYGALPVCDGDRLTGMITDRDIVVKVLAAGKDPASTTVSELGTFEVVTIGADDSVEQAMQTMSKHQVRRLPVIDGTTLVGMLAQADLARSGDDAGVGQTVEDISQ
jgi:CBS domain-containing protein